MGAKEKNRIVFEEYGIEFTDEDFEGIDKETLERCKRKLEEILEKFKNQ